MEAQNEKKVIEKYFMKKFVGWNQNSFISLKHAISMFLKMHGNTEVQSGSTTKTFPSTSSKTGFTG